MRATSRWLVQRTFPSLENRSLTRIATSARPDRLGSPRLQHHGHGRRPADAPARSCPVPWLPPAGGDRRGHHVLEAVAGAHAAVVAGRPPAVLDARSRPGRPASPARGSRCGARRRCGPTGGPRPRCGGGARTSRWTRPSAAMASSQRSRSKHLAPLLERAALPATPARSRRRCGGRRGWRCPRPAWPAGRATSAARPWPCAVASRSRPILRCSSAHRVLAEPLERRVGLGHEAAHAGRDRRPGSCSRLPIATQLRASSAMPSVSSSVSVGRPMRK